MTMTMRTLLLSALAQYMQGLDEPESRHLAKDLTDQISDRMVSKGALVGPAHRAPACFPPDTWNHLTVGVPWEAYARSHGSLRGEPLGSSVRAVCSAPAGLDSLLVQKAGNTGLWGGSLLVALGQMLALVQYELIVFAPYWRTDGVRSLLAASGRARYDGVRIKVFTQPASRLSENDRAGVRGFVDTLRQAGAQIALLAPRPVDGAWPFIHAKLMIADGRRAYVGSANFTSSGLDHGVESGVIVEGEVARAFVQWAAALEGGCSPWVRQGEDLGADEI